jgi:thiamine transport system ATP-binding protein
MLRVENLLYMYNKAEQNENYNFTLEANRGEIVGIVGASGNGKSTLLDLISGFLEPMGGNITFDNKEITNLAPEKRPITILFQNHNLFEHLSVEKNIMLGVKKRDIKDIKKILQNVGLKNQENKRASTLSGGQQQRVALARVLLRDKPILLLDEPFTGLDYKTKESMLELVKNITKSKDICTIMVTHDMSDCEKIANKVYEVKNGKLTLL